MAHNARDYGLLTSETFIK